MTEFILPRRRCGRPTTESRASYEEEIEAFCAGILELRSGLDFEVGSRGWGYVCESNGLISKDDIDLVQSLINDCRKSGALPLDICLVDEGRAFDHVEVIDLGTPEEQARWIVDYIHRAHLGYRPLSFWDDQDFYVQMMVEKSTLKSLFNPVCVEFHVPLATAGGWSDLHMRADMMRRYSEHEDAGKHGVLLYCGDFDPGGLRISDCLRTNMGELANAIGWSPDNLIIDRFGLNFEFIEANSLVWIENLVTGNKGQWRGVCLSDPKHPDHKKEYVQSYLAKYGVRKVEGEALVKVPEVGRDLCQQAILQYVNQDAISTYEERLVAPRAKVKAAVTRLLRRRR